jgi:hypothetical protein
MQNAMTLLWTPENRNGSKTYNMRGTANASYQQQYSLKAFVPIELQIQGSGGGVGQIVLFPSSDTVHRAQETNMRRYQSCAPLLRSGSNLWNSRPSLIYRSYVLKKWINEQLCFQKGCKLYVRPCIPVFRNRCAVARWKVWRELLPIVRNSV